MGWLRLVGSLKLLVSFAEYCLLYRALLQKRPIILRSLLIVATPYIQVTNYIHVYESTVDRPNHELQTHVLHELYRCTRATIESKSLFARIPNHKQQTHMSHEPGRFIQSHLLNLQDTNYGHV